MNKRGSFIFIGILILTIVILIIYFVPSINQLTGFATLSVKSCSINGSYITYTTTTGRTYTKLTTECVSNRLIKRSCQKFRNKINMIETTKTCSRAQTCDIATKSCKIISTINTNLTNTTPKSPSDNPPALTNNTNNTSPIITCSIKYLCESNKLIKQNADCTKTTIEDCGTAKICVVDGSTTQCKFSEGLIVIKKGASGENYAKTIASQKGWDILSVTTSNIADIKTQIKSKYDISKFKYLLMIGTNSEIPFAKLNSGYLSSSTTSGSYETDPSLYADIDNDGFIELNIGRLPFSSESELKKYFTDLSPKGENYYYEAYPFNKLNPADPMDQHTAIEWNYINCLAQQTSLIKNYKNSNLNDLINHYKTATLLQVATHGSPSSFNIGGTNKFTISSLCAGCTSGTICSCASPEYLSNRPILISLACSNSRDLGIRLLKDGASAFIGSYVESGASSISLSQKIINGATIGEAFKDMYNEHMVSETKVGTSLITNINKLNNFDLSTLTKPKDTYGLILYGDPSLRLPSPLNIKQSVNINKDSTKLTLEISKTNLLKLTEDFSTLCYTGSYISQSSFITSSIKNWMNLRIPLKGINSIISIKAIINGNIVDIATRGDIQYSTNLLKGTNEEVLYLTFLDSSQLDINDDNVLGYNKDFKIIIEYN